MERFGDESFFLTKLVENLPCLLSVNSKTGCLAHHHNKEVENISENSLLNSYLWCLRAVLRLFSFGSQDENGLARGMYVWPTLCPI